MQHSLCIIFQNLIHRYNMEVGIVMKNGKETAFENRKTFQGIKLRDPKPMRVHIDEDLGKVPKRRNSISSIRGQLARRLSSLSSDSRRGSSNRTSSFAYSDGSSTRGIEELDLRKDPELARRVGDSFSDTTSKHSSSHDEKRRANVSSGSSKFKVDDEILKMSANPERTAKILKRMRKSHAEHMRNEIPGQAAAQAVRRAERLRQIEERNMPRAQMVRNHSSNSPIPMVPAIIVADPTPTIAHSSSNVSDITTTSSFDSHRGRAEQASARVGSGISY